MEKGRMSQRPLSGATFVLIKEKHANAVKQNQRTRKKFIPSHQVVPKNSYTLGNFDCNKTNFDLLKYSLTIDLFIMEKF